VACRLSSPALLSISSPVAAAGGDRAPARFGNQPVVLPPLIRPKAQWRQRLGPLALKVLTQEIGEKVMVPVPNPVIVQRNGENILSPASSCRRRGRVEYV
jgi:hypothetical protein